MVVHHLQGQTGWFTVWVNGKQNSGLVNFVPESHFTVCTNQFHLWKNSRESLKYQRWLWKMEHKIMFVGNIPFSKTGQPSQMFHYSQKFSPKTTWKVVFHCFSFQPDFWKKLSNNQCYLTGRPPSECKYARQDEPL